jgi:hypothetical protein
MKRRNFLTGMIVSIVLFPWIPISSDLPELRPEWFIMLAGLLLFPVKERVIYSRVSAMACLVILTYLLSIVYGSIVMKTPFIYRDITPLLQPMLYLLIYIFIASGEYAEDGYRRILAFALKVLGLAAVLAIIQFFEPDLIAPILKLWASEDRIAEYKLSRATGSMGNPNDLGFLMAIGFALTLFTFPHRILPFRYSLPILLVTFLGVFASGSRTAMVCLLAILIVYYILELKKNLKQIILMTLVIITTIYIFNTYFTALDLFEGLISRINSFQNLGEDKAWQSRVFSTVDTLDLISESWLIGHGPAKLSFAVGENIDNEYILLLYRFGIIGTIVTAGFIYVLAKQQFKSSTSPLTLLVSIKNFIWASLFAGALFAYTAGLFMSFRLFTLLIILWTISACVRIERSPSTV